MYTLQYSVSMIAAATTVDRLTAVRQNNHLKKGME